MREINDYVLLSTDVDPQEEDAKKSLDFDDISEFRYHFFTVVSYIQSSRLQFLPLIQECMI